jgi:hypothetical protein
MDTGEGCGPSCHSEHFGHRTKCATAGTRNSVPQLGWVQLTAKLLKVISRPVYGIGAPHAAHIQMSASGLAVGTPDGGATVLQAGHRKYRTDATGSCGPALTMGSPAIAY